MRSPLKSTETEEERVSRLKSLGIDPYITVARAAQTKSNLSKITDPIHSQLKGVAKDPLGTAMNVGRAVGGDYSGLTKQVIANSGAGNDLQSVANSATSAYSGDYQAAAQPYLPPQISQAIHQANNVQNIAQDPQQYAQQQVQQYTAPKFNQLTQTLSKIPASQAIQNVNSKQNQASNFLQNIAENPQQYAQQQAAPKFNQLTQKNRQQTAHQKQKYQQLMKMLGRRSND